MRLYELAKRLANFVWDVDPYEARNTFDTFGECLEEIFDNLRDKQQRKAICKWLREFAFESRIPEDAEYAKKLAREVNAL